MEVIPAAQLARNAALATAAVGLAPDLKKRIEVMAEHVAKNGPNFEKTVRDKNKDIPGFGFLMSGEGAEYYQQCLRVHRDRQPSPLTPGPVAAPAHAGTSPSQVAPSDLGSVAELLQRWPEPPTSSLGPDGDRQLAGIVDSLETMASRDAIHTGRTWIEANVSVVSAIASNLTRRINHLRTCAHRLHILFLLHDVMQTELTRQEPAKPIIAAFKPYLVWMLRPAFQLAQSLVPNGEDCTKIRKLLQLWGERGVFSAREADEVRTLIEIAQLPANIPKGLGPGMVAPTMLHQSPSAAPLAPGLQLPGGGALQIRPTTGGAYGASGPVFGAAGAGFTPGGHLVLPTHPPGAQMGFAGAQPTGPVPSHRLAFTPESVPVGVMALMLKQVSKRGKDLHTAFVPYKPLDPLYTPQVLPPAAPPTSRLLERLSELYDILGDAAKEPPKAIAVLPAEIEPEGACRRDGRSRSPRGSSPVVPPAAPDGAPTGAGGAAVPPPANLG